MCCEHVSCGSSERVWLPYVHHGRELGLKPHPYCVKCGIVKNISSERPRGIGYYLNLVSMLGRNLKVTKVHMRLISQELQKAGINDTYSMERSQQQIIFTSIVSKYLNVSEVALRKLL